VVDDEAGLFVEGQRMLVRRYLDPADPATAGNRDQVQHERPAEPLPHPFGIHEQILDLDAIPGAEPGGEADDAIIGDRDSGASFPYRQIGEFQDLRMGEQIRPVALVGQG